MSVERLDPQAITRPCDEHDRRCTGVRWLVQPPIVPGSRLVEICAGCTAVRIAEVRGNHRARRRQAREGGRRAVA